MYYILYNEFIFFLLLILIAFFLVRKLVNKKNVVSRWNILIEHLEYSPQKVYERIEETLRERRLDSVRFSEKKLREGSIFSSKRVYKKIKWKEYSYFICAAPFADSFFVSYRVCAKNPFFITLLASTPFIGSYLVKWFAPMSWYKEDTIQTFYTMMHEISVKVINEIAKDNDLPQLTEKQTTPQMADLFKRT